MNVEVEFALQIMATELSETVGEKISEALYGEMEDGWSTH